MLNIERKKQKTLRAAREKTNHRKWKCTWATGSKLGGEEKGWNPVGSSAAATTEHTIRAGCKSLSMPHVLRAMRLWYNRHQEKTVSSSPSDSEWAYMAFCNPFNQQSQRKGVWLLRLHTVSAFIAGIFTLDTSSCPEATMLWGNPNYLPWRDQMDRTWDYPEQEGKREGEEEGDQGQEGEPWVISLHLLQALTVPIPTTNWLEPPEKPWAQFLAHRNCEE